MTASFFWPATSLKPRAQCAVVARGALYVPAWTEPQTIFTFNGQLVSEVAVSPAPAPGEVQTGEGFIAAAADSAGTPWFLSGSGVLTALTASNVAGTVLTLPAGVYTGLVPDASGRFYATRADGGVYPVAGGVVGAQIGSFGAKAQSPAMQGTTLYACLPESSAVGTMAVGSGAIATIPTPMNQPAFLALNAGQVAVAGWSYSVLPGTAGGIAVSPAVASQIAYTAGGQLTLAFGTDPAFVTESSLAVAGAGALAWSTNGEQVLVAGSAGVVVAGIAEGALTLSQTLGVTGVTALAATSDGAEVLAVTPGSGGMTVLSVAVGAWSIGQTLSVPGIASLLLLTPIAALAIGSAGITPLSRSGSTWSAGASIALPFTPTAIFQDAGGAILVCGTSGSTGIVAIVSSAGAVLSSLSWSGSAKGVASLDGQIMVADSASSLIHFFSEVGGILLAQGAGATANGCSALFVTGTTVWVAGVSFTWQTQLGGPFMLRRVRAGVLAIYASNAWMTLTLGVSHDPSAIAFDSAGALHVVTAQNDHFVYATGALTVSTVPVYAGQLAGTSLSLSALVNWNGHLYATTSASGVIVEIA